MSAAQKNTHDSQETRIALLEQSIGHIDQTLLRLEKKIDGMETGLIARIDTVESRLGNHIVKIDSRLWQIIFLIASSVITIVLARIFHWF